jgi:hypothetical protein
MTKPMPEEHDLSAPVRTNVHTVEECDRMLRLPLAPEVADAWLDERDLAVMADQVHRRCRRSR